MWGSISATPPYTLVVLMNQIVFLFLDSSSLDELGKTSLADNSSEGESELVDTLMVLLKFLENVYMNNVK